jgi:hypothetical protein
VSQLVRGADSVSGGKATGSLAHAEGTSSASATGAHAEGSSAASASNSHAEGNSSAGGSTAHAEGQSSANGVNSHAEGASTATATYSHAEGNAATALRLAQHAKAGATFASSGDAQYSNYVPVWNTTDATPATLTNTNNTVVTTGTSINVLTIPASRAFYVRVEGIARRTDVIGESAAWTITCALVRDVSGVPRFIGTPTTATLADAGASTWTLVPTLVTIAGPVYYLALIATGEAAKNIRWVATMHTTEVG